MNNTDAQVVFIQRHALRDKKQKEGQVLNKHRSESAHRNPLCPFKQHRESFLAKIFSYFRLSSLWSLRYVLAHFLFDKGVEFLIYGIMLDISWSPGVTCYAHQSRSRFQSREYILYPWIDFGYHISLSENTRGFLLILTSLRSIHTWSK
jgi:hypothetical protein